MSDHTRESGDGALGREPERASCSGEVAPVSACLGDNIDRLIAEGSVILGLVGPWSDEVHIALRRFEALVRPLLLDDDLHKTVGDAAGIGHLYEQLDALVLAGGEVC